MSDDTTTPEPDDVEGHKHARPITPEDSDDVEGHRHTAGRVQPTDADRNAGPGH